MDIRDKRCGKNGTNLLDNNFVSKDSQKAKPPPPTEPAPVLSKAAEKQLVFLVPENEAEDEADGEGKVVVQKTLLNNSPKEEK